MAITLTAPRLAVKNILYATDFSGPARAALPYATSWARQFRSMLHLVHVVAPVTSLTPFEPFPIDTRGPAEQQMAEFLRTNILSSIVHEGHIEEGNLWIVLRNLLLEQRFDLVVVGTHGRNGLGKLALGSVAEEIIRSAACPVLAVGPSVPIDPTPGNKVRAILCAADLLPDSTAAMDYSFALARETGAHLTFLHAIPSANGGTSYPLAAKWEAKGKLEGLLREKSLSPAPSLVVDVGPAPEVIAGAARKENADLIVMGVRHTDHPWLSSHAAWVTIHQVLARAACPVLTVRA